MKLHSIVPKTTKRVAWVKGDIITRKDIPKWAKHLTENYPQHQCWIHPQADGTFKILLDVTLEKHPPEITINVQQN